MSAGTLARDAGWWRAPNSRGQLVWHHFPAGSVESTCTKKRLEFADRPGLMFAHRLELGAGALEGVPCARCSRIRGWASV